MSYWGSDPGPQQILCQLDYSPSSNLCVFIAHFSCLEIQSYSLHNLILFQGTLRILEEENHIKDVLSRIVVEMIKREWPQHWPDMLMELDTLFRQGVWRTCVLATCACVRSPGGCAWWACPWFYPWRVIAGMRTRSDALV